MTNCGAIWAADDGLADFPGLIVTPASQYKLKATDSNPLAPAISPTLKVT